MQRRFEHPSPALALLLALLAATRCAQPAVAGLAGRVMTAHLPVGMVAMLRSYHMNNAPSASPSQSTGQQQPASNVADVVAAFDNSYNPSTAPKLDMRTLMQGNSSQPINTTQAAIVAATLSLTGTSLSFTGALIRLIAATLSLGGSSVALPVADFRRSAARAQFSFATYGFGQQLYNDFNSLVQRDNLGTAARYIKQWNQLRSQLEQAHTQVQSQMQQLNTATATAEAIAKNFASSNPQLAPQLKL